MHGVVNEVVHANQVLLVHGDVGLDTLVSGFLHFDLCLVVRLGDNLQLLLRGLNQFGLLTDRVALSGELILHVAWLSPSEVRITLFRVLDALDRLSGC